VGSRCNQQGACSGDQILHDERLRWKSGNGQNTRHAAIALVPNLKHRTLTK
jgi:hypothetical protein